MYRFLFSFISFLFSSLTLSAQQFAINKTVFWGGANGEILTRYIPTRDGGLLGLGYTSSNDGDVMPHPSVTTQQNVNALIVKYDSLGNVKWNKVYGGSSGESAASAAQTADGGYVVLGVNGSPDYDVSEHIGTGPTIKGDIWLLRLDAQGNKLWDHSYGSTGSDGGVDIVVTPDKGYLFLGITTGSDSDVAYHMGSTVYFDWVLIKTDSMGNRQWRKMLAGTVREDIDGHLFLGPDSCYYIAGRTSLDGNVEPDSLWPGGVVPSVTAPTFIKLDSQGNIIWNRKYGATTGGGSIMSGFLDMRDTTIVICGTTSGNDNYFTGNHLNDQGQPSLEMYVMKVDLNGNFKWSKLYGTKYLEEGYAIAPFGENGFVLGGTVTGVVPLVTPYIGGLDVLLYLLDDTGKVLTNKIFGSPGNLGNEYVYALKYSNKHLYACGYSLSPGNFTEGQNTGNATNGNLYVTTMDYWSLSVPEAHEQKNGLKLMPNPARSAVEIQLPDSGNGWLDIYNAAGQRVFRQKPHQKNITVTTNDWPSGIYYVTYTSNKDEKIAASLQIQ